MVHYILPPCEACVIKRTFVKVVNYSIHNFRIYSKTFMSYAKVSTQAQKEFHHKIIKTIRLEFIKTTRLVLYDALHKLGNQQSITLPKHNITQFTFWTGIDTNLFPWWDPQLKPVIGHVTTCPTTIFFSFPFWFVNEEVRRLRNPDT